MSIAYKMDLALEMSPSQPCSTPQVSDRDPSKISRESSVTCIYQAMLAGSLRNIAVTWSRVSAIHSLAITIENLSDEDHQTCQIEFQSWQSWSRKGLKSLHVDYERVDVYWDFRAVKFSPNPEPSSDYYVAIVFRKQIVLLLGDSKAEAIKRTMSRPSPEGPTLLHKEEILCGIHSFHTRMLLEASGVKGHDVMHDVMIENPKRRHSEPELRISIDGRMLVRVMNLNWRFRGNETVLVNNVPVQIFWDVHDWLFSNPGSGHGLFIFKPGSLKNVFDNDQRDSSCRRGSHDDGEYKGHEDRSTGGCCHFIFAVKVLA